MSEDINFYKAAMQNAKTMTDIGEARKQAQEIAKIMNVNLEVSIE